MLRRARAITVRSVSLACASVAVILGCDASEAPRANQHSDVDVRIASFSPAMTATLVDLGFEHAIAGRSPWCTDVSKALPVVGDFREFDAERILLVRPTHIVLQPPLSGLDAALTTLATEQGITLVPIRIDRMKDVRSFVAEIAKLNMHTERVQSRLASLDAMPSISADDPRVLLLVNAEPMLVAGAQTYLSDLLPIIHLQNAMGREGWIESSHEALGLLEPDLLLGIAEHEDNLATLRRSLEAVPCRAARDRRIVVVVAGELLRPSTRALDAIKALEPEIARVLAVETGAKP